MNIIRGLTLIGVTAFCFLAVQANETPVVTELQANHTLIATASDGNGLNTITVEMTVTNNTGLDLQALKLALVPDPKLTVIGDPRLELTALNSYQSTIVHWSLMSPLPAEIVVGAKPLLFTGQALDAYSQPVLVTVTSGPQE